MAGPILRANTRPAVPIPIAANAKFTENGKTVAIGEGFWKTAGEAKLKRSALDTQTCSSVTESVKYTDFHMFKVRGGEVHGVHAVLAEADQLGW